VTAIQQNAQCVDNRSPRQQQAATAAAAALAIAAAADHAVQSQVAAGGPPTQDKPFGTPPEDIQHCGSPAAVANIGTVPTVGCEQVSGLMTQFLICQEHQLVVQGSSTASSCRVLP